MSYTYLRDQGEESSAESFSDIPAFVLWRLNLTAAASSYNASETESCLSFPFGMTSEPSTAGRGVDSLMSLPGDFHVKTSAVPEGQTQKEFTASTVDYGLKWRELFVRFDQVSFSWKTHHSLFIEDLQPSWVTLPEWGMMQSGECWERTTLEHPIIVNECGYLPTITEFDAAGGDLKGKEWDGITKHAMKLSQAVRLFRTSQASDADRWNNVTESERKARGQQVRINNQLGVGGKLNPPWVEWLMGWPIEWTGLGALETAKFRQWLNSHGKL